MKSTYLYCFCCEKQTPHEQVEPDQVKSANSELQDSEKLPEEMFECVACGCWRERPDWINW